VDGDHPGLLSGTASQNADPPHPPCLLRSRRDRPSRREKRDEIATLHYSITTSARARSSSGTAKSMALGSSRKVERVHVPSNRR
jgi:hypothetical protein